ncbi:MAG: bshA [Bacillales bacterium]|nr:bshA [Bacillales bacterium]
MRKLKIGIVCYPTVGGSGIVATELGKSLAEKGHEIHFISSSVPFRLNKRVPNVYFHQSEADQYSVFQYPPYTLPLASKIAEIAKLENLDIIHTHYAVPHAVCGILAKQMTHNQLKVVTTLHGTDITILGQDSSWAEVIKFAIEKSDAVTAVSNSLKHETMEVIHPDQQIETIYNFVNPTHFSRINTDLKNELGIEPHEKVILHVSNFRKVKQIDDIVHAFALTLQSVQAKLLLVGDGPEWSAVHKLAVDLGIQDQILMLGKQENLQEIYSISDAFLLLSSKESFGVVLLEAMACGVPCIGTNIGGIPEVIRDNENGFIVPNQDIEYTSARLVELLTNDQLQERFSKQALLTVQEHFLPENIICQYEDLYYRVLDQVEEKV